MREGSTYEPFCSAGACRGGPSHIPAGFPRPIKEEEGREAKRKWDVE